MNNLTAVKRPDKTGKVVTRHVKADPRSGAIRSTMPAPSLGPQPKEQPTKLKLRPKQTERRRENGMWGDMDERLERTGVVAKSAYYGFTASEEEMYGVLSVTTVSGNVVKLLSEGVRNAEEARDYLSRHNLGDLIVDRSAFTDEALRKNVRVESFVLHSGSIKPRHDPSDAIDAVTFAASPLAQGNYEAEKDILEGDISYADIKYIGVSKLKASGRLGEILPLLRQLHKGEAPCTLDDLKYVVDSAATQRIEGIHLKPVIEFIQAGGIETVRQTSDLQRIMIAYSDAQWNHHRGTLKRDAFEQADYAIRVTNGVADQSSSGIAGATVLVIDDYIEAGIPVDITIETMANGGDITDAIVRLDARKNGVNSNFTDGWL